ncbi:putative PurR-regulated permease PerM [Methanocalculus alkaliphilus]|uniref:AI-2E family transporter n=1 Tax=Methanocalculus alkaliphilus TaxID=768730 RepID=UPI00209F45D9|nr:AI-2E family transporter [Methanocalculus alkaliphilus]MCP1715204.1 putative PurR-regulated permease PerM [Methanocalculus alkaliphilus]
MPGGGYPDKNVLLVTGVIMAAAAIFFWQLLAIIILAGTLAVILLPIHRQLTRVINPGVSALLIATFVIVFVTFVISFTIAVFYTNSALIEEIIDTILLWLTTLGASGTPTVGESELNDWITLQINNLTAWGISLIYHAPRIVLDILIFLMALMAFLYKGEEMYIRAVNALPGRLSSGLREISKTVVDTLYAIYVVHVVTALITFLLAIPFFYVLGYDHILFYATIAAMFQLVPILGPSLLMLFLGIYAFSMGDYRGVAMIGLVGYPVVCALPDLVFRPLIMGMRASINPLLMWIGFFGGLAIMGLIGFILGPLIIAFVVSGYILLLRELEMAKKQEVASDPKAE